MTYCLLTAFHYFSIYAVTYQQVLLRRSGTTHCLIMHTLICSLVGKACEWIGCCIHVCDTPPKSLQCTPSNCSTLFLYAHLLCLQCVTCVKVYVAANVLNSVEQLGKGMLIKSIDFSRRDCKSHCAGSHTDSKSTDGKQSGGSAWDYSLSTVSASTPAAFKVNLSSPWPYVCRCAMLCNLIFIFSPGRNWIKG